MAKAKENKLSIRKVVEAHGPFECRSVMGNHRECVVCKEYLDSGRARECRYCPEKIYCTRSCQAKDWPEHKKDCRMGKGKKPDEFGEQGTVNKVIAEHGAFPSRSRLGDQRKCVVCEGRPGLGPSQECYYCPGKIYCSEVCQAKDWPEHKKECKMGEVGMGPRIREA